METISTPNYVSTAYAKFSSYKRHLYLYGEIAEPENYTSLFKEMDLDWDLENLELILHLNSPGGYISSLIPFVQRLKKVKHLITVGEGRVFSAALFMFMLGKIRIAYPSTVFLMHSIQNVGVSGPVTPNSNYVNLIKKQSNVMIDATFKPFFKKNELENIKNGHDHYFDMEEAILRKIVTQDFEDDIY